MPSYTLGQIMSIVTRNTGRRVDIEPSTISQLVNEAYFEIAFAADHQAQEKIAVSSTTSGENKITLPTDTVEVISAALLTFPSGSTNSSQHSSYHTLTRISIADADAQNPQPSAVPEQFAFYNDWIELYPSPNSAYSIQLRYRSGVTDLVELTDVPSLSTPWRIAIPIKAEEKVHRMLDNPAGEQAANLRYLQYVSQLETDRARRQKGEFRMYATPMVNRGRLRRAPRR